MTKLSSLIVNAVLHVVSCKYPYDLDDSDGDHLTPLQWGEEGQQISLAVEDSLSNASLNHKIEYYSFHHKPHIITASVVAELYEQVQ